MTYHIKKRMYSHPQEAIKYLRRFTAHRKWACPHCGCMENIHKHSTDKRNIIIYKCYHCKKTFSELYGTIFHKSKVPLSKWLLTIIYWTDSTGSLSASQLRKNIKVSYLTAWNMLMKIRVTLLNSSKDNSMLSGLVEADEAWFGKKKNDNQDIVMGMVERNRRKLILIQIPNVKEATLYPHILDNVEKGSKFFTDQRITYSVTGIYYHHQTTNHSKGEFARAGNIHSNTIEQIWGDIKGIIRTIHHGISRKYRHLYLAQYAFKYQFYEATNFFYKTLSTLFFPCYCIY